MKRLVFSVVLALSVFAQGGAKRPLSHRDYDSWRTIQRPTLSSDGRYLAYGLFPQDGDGELVVRDLKTGEERREKAGALPPPPDTSIDREPGEEPPTIAIRIAFTADSRHLVFSTFPSKADTDAARKAKKEAPKGGLGILDLQSRQSALRVAGVKSFQVPDKQSAFLAYLKEPVSRPPADPAKPDPAKPATEQPRGQTATPQPPPWTSTTARRPEFGTELVLRDLSAGKDRSFADVLEYSLTKDGVMLVYAVASRNADANGIYALATSREASAAPVLTGKGKYQKLTWDLKQTQLAFLSDRDDAASKPSRSKLYLWRRGAGAVDEVVSTETPGFRKEFVISTSGQIAFSRDGSRLFFGAGPQVPEEREDRSSQEDVAVADLWHWRDPYIQPMQKVRAARERARSYRAVYHIADKKLVQLADDSLAGVLASDDGRFAIGTDDRSYRSMIDYDRLYMDYYLINTVTGERKRLIEKGDAGFLGGPSIYWSPDGDRVLFYRDRDWHIIHVADGRIANVTAALPAKFFNEESDTPGAPGSYGTAGWTRDSKWVLVYDRFDVWRISADGKDARNLTDGVGRKEKLEFRVVRLERDDEEEPRGIDATRPLLLRAESIDTRDSGFWKDSVSVATAPSKLLMGARNYRTWGKARNADVVLMTASTFNDYPDLQVTDSTFRTARKVTDANPQKSQFTWGTSELISFRSSDGVPLKAAMYKPENFDSHKKYPMLVYIYEKLSQNVHSFVDPRPSHNPNIAYYVSNGYVVLTPDIVYTIGSPGQSALKCVLPAIQEAVDRGGINESAIGIAGHSWGGYQTAYLATQTTRFKAIESGAPVGNMTSAYNGIRWGSGLPRQFQYERTQSRIGQTLWDSPLQFMANSPVFHVRNVQTPMLILHNDQDDAVPWYQGIELYLSLRRNGKEAYLFNYNGEKHHLRRRPNQKDYTLRMQQFFDHYLKGAPSPAWMEKGIPFLERDEEKARFMTSDR